MAKLTAEARKNISKSQFGVPSKAPGPGSYPMPDKAHAANAKARAAGKPVEAQVDAKANKILHKSADGSVVSGADAEEAEMSREKGGSDAKPNTGVARASSGAMIRSGIQAMHDKTQGAAVKTKVFGKPKPMKQGGTISDMGDNDNPGHVQRPSFNKD